MAKTLEELVVKVGVDLNRDQTQKATAGMGGMFGSINQGAGGFLRSMGMFGFAIPALQGLLGGLKNTAMDLAWALKAAQLVSSTSEALRMVAQGAVRVNGERISENKWMLKPQAEYLCQVGKRRLARLQIVSQI